MKNTYIIIVLIVLVLGAVLIFGMGKKAEAPLSEIQPEIPPEMPDGKVCTMDVKLCPDGSYVGRTGPNCEFTACPVATNNQTTKEFIVTGQNFSFTPSLIEVNKGDKVRVIFKNTLGFHDFKIDEYGVATKQANSPTTEILEFTADKTGSFEYYCSVGTHRTMGMKGTLKVV